MHLPKLVNPPRCGRKRLSLDSVVDDRYPLSMSEASDLATDQDMNAADLAWLEAALEEYKALLQYLREH